MSGDDTNGNVRSRVLEVEVRALTDMVKDGFARIDRRFDQVDETVGRVAGKLSRTDDRVRTLEQDVPRDLHTRLGALEKDTASEKGKWSWLSIGVGALITAGVGAAVGVVASRFAG